MFKRLLTLIAKTTVITITVCLSLGIGFVAMLVFLFALGAGIASGGQEVAEIDGLEMYDYHYGDKDADARFVSIPINGVIMGEQQSTDEFFSNFVTEGIVYGYEVKEQLQELANEEDVAGVVLEINSPGGTIFGSQAIADGVKEYKEKTGKPVVAYVASVAASGGYWVAASADEIIADHGTTLGSIGVILGPFKYYDGVVSEDGGILMGGIETENGITTEYITAGKYKDAGNPYRELTSEERAILQEGVDNSYNTFVSYVAERRKIDEAAVRDTIGALPYDDIKSVELKLSDATGNKDQAYDRLAELAKISDYKIIQRSGTGSFWEMLQEATFGFGSEKTVQSGCLFEKHSLLLAYYGDVRALCR